MKISSRKKLLIEADIELEKIRLAISEENFPEKQKEFWKKYFETDKKGKEELGNFVEKIAKTNTNVEIKTLEKQLEILKNQLESEQESNDFSNMEMRDKVLHFFKMKHGGKEPDGIWEKFWINFDAFMRGISNKNLPFRDPSGNFYDPNTGKKWTEKQIKNWKYYQDPNVDDATIGSGFARYLSLLIRALTL